LNGKTLHLINSSTEQNCFDTCFGESACEGAEFNGATTPKMCRLYSEVSSVGKDLSNGNKVFVKKCLY